MISTWQVSVSIDDRYRFHDGSNCYLTLDMKRDTERIRYETRHREKTRAGPTLLPAWSERRDPPHLTVVLGHAAFPALASDPASAFARRPKTRSRIKVKQAGGAAKGRLAQRPPFPRSGRAGIVRPGGGICDSVGDAERQLLRRERSKPFADVLCSDTHY